MCMWIKSEIFPSVNFKCGKPFNTWIINMYTEKVPGHKRMILFTNKVCSKYNIYINFRAAR